MFACVNYARCGVVFTPSVAYKGIAVVCKRNNWKNSKVQMCSPLLPSCRWPSCRGRRRPWFRIWPPYPACFRVNWPCKRLFCSSEICGGIFVFLELLSWTSSDWKIGSNGGVNFESSLRRFLFYFKKFSWCSRKVSSWPHWSYKSFDVWTYLPPLFVSFSFSPSSNIQMVFMCKFV